ncbi:MAG TPA: type III secretion system export apparatus subunit SctR [Albitalea sp.]|uniref:type III secretion system export apparatus subunit SctR n=1 Tax=Piscinibacter sp. TaxID=1903157 RepID=UPI002ED17C09
MTGTDPYAIALFIAALTLMPLILITTTSFLKISIVLLIVRNALGVQQVPPTLALHAMALMMTAFVMAPTLRQMADVVQELRSAPAAQQQTLVQSAGAVVEPLRRFMLRHTKAEQRDVFLEKARKLWGEAHSKDATSKDFLILVPAFMISQMQAGFEMGFLIYVPFLVIDVLVSNILLALGMQMMSPMTLSVPLKLFLFVVVDGWGKLLNSMLDSYL